jgi:hypothetical protein
MWRRTTCEYLCYSVKKNNFMKIYSLKSLSLLLVVAAVMASCHKHDDIKYAEKGDLEIEFAHRAGDRLFNYNQNYVTAAGDTVNFETFNYFVSNFKLTKEDGSEYIVPKDDCYFLVEHGTDVTRTIKLKDIPGGRYKSVSFMIGVDSLKSTSPISERTGALDPIKDAAGMYWSWNSGYIFLKLEGTSPQAPLNSFTGERSIFYHVGGYGGFDSASPTMNNLKTIKAEKAGEIAEVGLLAEGDHDHNSGSDKGVVPHMHFYVDVLELFTAPTTFKVADHPIIHWGDFAKTIANNYQDMFVLDHIHN